MSKNRLIGILMALIAIGSVCTPARAVTRTAACMAVTAGAVYVAGVIGANQYSKVWRVSFEGPLHDYRINSAGIFRTTPVRSSEDMLLGSTALGRIAAFVLDPVGEVSDCIRPERQCVLREYGTASNGPRPHWDSNFFVNISLVNLGGGLSFKYVF